MSSELILVIGAITIPVLATLRGVGLTGFYAYKLIKKIYLKKKIKKKIKKYIDDLNYTKFLQIIYDCKIFDGFYLENLFNELKLKYNFNEENYSTYENFLKRFDILYEQKNDNLIKNLKKEIELSFSKKLESILLNRVNSSNVNDISPYEL